MANPSEMAADRLSRFIDEARLSYPFHGVLRVGSSSRGYDLEDSDIDLMAFYDTGGTLRSYPVHSNWDNIRVTIEHHDLERFSRTTASYPHSLASLRQRLKIRDSIPVQEDGTLSVFRRSCRSVFLDRTILLHACALFVANWQTILASRPAVRRLRFLRWSELFATLDLLCSKGGVAYSKPKWLHRTLRAAERNDAERLLNYLDALTPTRAGQMAKSLNELVGAHPFDSFGPAHEAFCETATRDALAMVRAFPLDAGPALRFAVAGYYRLIFGTDILDAAANDTLASPFSAIFETELPGGYDERSACEAFLNYARCIASTTCEFVDGDFDPMLGSSLFPSYILYAHGVPDLMQCTLRGLDLVESARHEPVRQWLEDVQGWCADASGRALPVGAS